LSFLSSEDSAILLQVIAGHDPQDPSTSTRAVPDFRASLEDGIKGMRIGVVRHFYESDSRASDETVAAMDAGVEVLRALGAQVEDVKLAPLDDYQACYRAIMMAESFAIHAADLRSHPERYAAVTRYRILPGAFMSAADYLNALRFQRVLIAQTHAAMLGLDALLTATIYGPAPVQASMKPDAAFSRPALTNPFNIAQLPAMNVCNGFAPDGLPLGMQVVGHPFEEATVLRIARAYERDTPWRERRPQLLAAAETDKATPEGFSIVDVANIDPSLMARYRALAQGAGLSLDEQQLAQLCEAMPHVERLQARIPDARNYADSPSILFRHP
jgi:aspartyl-tRNA(Asn)/glutamyl-tRNA(Gln) amidotransferase subunit A